MSPWHIPDDGNYTAKGKLNIIGYPNDLRLGGTPSEDDKILIEKTISDYMLLQNPGKVNIYAIRVGRPGNNTRFVVYTNFTIMEPSAIQEQKSTFNQTNMNAFDALGREIFPDKKEPTIEIKSPIRNQK